MKVDESFQFPGKQSVFIGNSVFHHDLGGQTLERGVLKMRIKSFVDGEKSIGPEIFLHHPKYPPPLLTTYLHIREDISDKDGSGLPQGITLHRNFAFIILLVPMSAILIATKSQIDIG